MRPLRRQGLRVVHVNYTAFKFMGDDDLAERVEKLQRKVEALSQANTTIALRMLEEFTAALEAAREELRRRACDSKSQGYG